MLRDESGAVTTLYRPTLSPTQRAARDARRALQARMVRLVPVQESTPDELPAPRLDELPVYSVAEPVVRYRTDNFFAFGPKVCAPRRTWEKLDDRYSNRDRVLVDDVIRAVCKYFNLRRVELLADRKARDITRPRQIGMYLAHGHTTRSYCYIARKFGRSDHTTAIHAVRRVHGLILEGNREATEAVDILSAQFA